MYIDLIAWDVEDDPDGNHQHIVGAGEVTAEEVEEVLSKHHAVVYCDESDVDLVVIRPVTAYPVQEYGG